MRQNQDQYEDVTTLRAFSCAVSKHCQLLRALAVNILLAALAISSSQCFAACVSPPAGMVAWWQAEGNALDSAGTNNGITNSGVNFVYGKVGVDFGLDGVTGLIQVPDSPSLNPTTEITVEAWYRPVSFVGSGANPIVTKDYSSFNPPYYQYNLNVTIDGYVNGSGDHAVFSFVVAAGGQVKGISTTNGFWTPGNCYYLVGTYDGSAVKLYVNGTLINQSPASGTLQNYGKPLLIGGSTFYPSYLPGTIDEVSIYNRALSANEIAAIYLADSAGKCAGAPPAIIANPQSQTVPIGTDAILGVTATGVTATGTSSLRYRWQLGGINLVDNVRTTGATSNLLRITGVETNDMGSYRVVITNAYGSITSNPALLTIVALPSILLQPTNQTVNLGANATFQVLAAGTSPFAYQWLRAGAKLVDNARISGSRSNWLSVSNVLLSDVGNYQVLVTNAYGSILSAVAVLNVNQAPTIRVQPQSQVVPLGASDTVTVIATGVPPPSYQWRFKRTNLADNAHITGSHGNTLAIASLLTGDAGNYDVVISNAYGSITSVVAFVKFSNPAPPPANVAPSVIWAREGGGPAPQWNPGQGYDEVTSAAGDGKGGVYVAGKFGEYARFGTIELSAPGSAPTFFLVKYDAAGNPVWEKHGWSDDGANGRYARISGLASTPDGGVVVAGWSYAPAMIDGQFIDVDTNTALIGICPTCASRFTFLAKYDAEGNRVWLHTIYSGLESSHQGVAVDPSGNVSVLVRGGSSYNNVYAAVDIDGQIFRGTESSQSGTSIGWFLVKFDPAGQLQSANEVIPVSNSPYTVDLYGSDVDAEGNLYITGRFSAGGGLGYYTYTLNVGSVLLSVTDLDDRGADVWFAAKLDANGDGLWVKQIGPGGHADWRLKVDGGGNVYVSGWAGDTLASNVLIKLDPYGHVLWTKNGVTGAMTCDAAGNVVMAGGYYKTDFETLTGQTVAGPFGSGIGAGLIGFSPSGQIRFSRFFSETVGGYGSSLQPGVIVQDSPSSWLLAGSFEVNGKLDAFQLQTPWPGRDIEDFIARLAIPATNDLPLITIPPEDITVFETRPLQLEVSAVSLSPMNYRWRFNGLPVANGTSNTLNFTNAGLSLSGTYSVSVSNANGGLNSALATVTVVPLTELAKALNATNLQWRLGGARSWQLDTNVTHDGNLSLRTDYLLAGVDPVEDCWIETTVQGPGVLSFWWKASTRDHNIYCGCDDGFQFRLDGVQQFEILGDVDWQPRSLPIGSGMHTVRWYWSEPNVPGNLNLCWVDQVSFQSPQTGAPTITNVKRLADGKFQFTINSAAGATLGIEACSDLRSWLPVGQLVATNGVAVFTHAAANNYQQHYYRAVLITP